AVDAIRRLRVGGHVVELRGRLVVHARPRLAAVEGHHRAAVVAVDHPQRVLRIDPQVVVVAVRDAHHLERLAAVAGPPGVDVQDPYRLRILRIGGDVVVIPGALTEVAVLGALRPRLAVVVAAIDRAVLGLDDRVHASAARRGRADADPAHHALWQAFGPGDLGPRVAAVVRAEDAAARTTGHELPGPADRLPEGRVDDPRVVRIQGEVDRARPIVPVEHALPGRAAVARAVDAALRVGAVRVPERRDVDGVRVAGMHADLADVARALEPQVRPGRARVGRAVHPVAVRHVAADAALAHPDVDHVRVALGDRDRADRRALEEPVRDVLPVVAAVAGLPHATAGRAEIEGVAGARVAGHGSHAPAAERAGLPPFELVEDAGGRAAARGAVRARRACRARTARGHDEVLPWPGLPREPSRSD